MSPTQRLIIGLGVIELCLAALWIWLANVAANSSTAPDAQTTIGQTIGGAMGLIFGLGCAILIVRTWRKGRS